MRRCWDSRCGLRWRRRRRRRKITNTAAEASARTDNGSVVDTAIFVLEEDGADVSVVESGVAGSVIWGLGVMVPDGESGEEGVEDAVGVNVPSHSSFWVSKTYACLL